LILQHVQIAGSPGQNTGFESENESGQEIDSDRELVSEPISIQATPFKTELLNIRSWEDVWDNAGSVIDFFSDYFRGLEGPEDKEEEFVSDDTDQIPAVTKLKTFCSKYVFAENTESDNFLKTNFFKEFPRQFFSSLPLVVSLGTKGSGKTFHFMRMTGFMTYKKFCDRIEPDKTEIDSFSPPSSEKYGCLHTGHIGVSTKVTFSSFTGRSGRSVSPCPSLPGC